jgi:hypothetical protein
VDVSLGADEGLEIGAFTFSTVDRRMNASHTGEKVEASFTALCTEKLIHSGYASGEAGKVGKLS